MEHKIYKLYESLAESEAFNFLDGREKAYSVADFINKIAGRSPAALRRHLVPEGLYNWLPLKSRPQVRAKLKDLMGRVHRHEVADENLYNELKQLLFCCGWWWDEFKRMVCKRRWRFTIRLVILALLLALALIFGFPCLCTYCHFLFLVCLGAFFFLLVFLTLSWSAAAYGIFDRQVVLPKSTYDTVRFAVGVMAGFAGSACAFLATRSQVILVQQTGIFLFVLSLSFGLWSVLFLTAVSQDFEETLEEGKRPVVCFPAKFWCITETLFLGQVMLFAAACVALLVGALSLGK